MSRTVGVTLMLIILLVNFYISTASYHSGGQDGAANHVISGRYARPRRAASHGDFHVSKVHIRQCRCRVLPSGKIKCRSPLFPTSHAERQDLIKCFCSKANRHNFPDFQKSCRSWRPNFPISMM